MELYSLSSLPTGPIVVPASRHVKARLAVTLGRWYLELPLWESPVY
jgi:hypothetical protein